MKLEKLLLMRIGEVAKKEIISVFFRVQRVGQSSHIFSERTISKTRSLDMYG